MLALAVMVFWGAYVARQALLLIYVSALFAIGFSPLVRFIERQPLLRIGTRLPRWLAILVIYVTIIGTVAVAGFLVVPPLVKQAGDLWSQLPQLFAKLQTKLMSWGLTDHPITIREAVERAPGTGSDAAGTIVNTIFGLAGGIFGVFTILILTFYLLIETDALFANFLRVFPAGNRARIRDVSRTITTKISAWLVGQLVLALTIGVSSAIGLGLLGVPYFYVLALISAIGEVIPVVGPILAAIPALLVALTVSPSLTLGVLIFFIVQQQIENHVLVPKVMERQVGVTASTVIMALLIGGSLLGIVGALLAVPTAAIIQVLFQELLPGEPAAPASDSRST